jgi:uncharacterized membrane protein YhaH (DUF805 family)
MSVTGVLFSFTGRIPRKSYWLGLCATGVAAVLALVAVKLLFRFGPVERTWASVVAVNVVITFLLLGALWPVMAVTIKRLHDRGRSWLTLVLPSLFLFGSLAAQRVAEHIYEGKLLVKTDDPMELTLLLAPFLTLPTHTYALIGAFVFSSNAPRVASSISGGFWDYAAAFYAGQALAGLIYLAIGLWFFWEVGLRRGTVGPNKYGADPLT